MIEVKVYEVKSETRVAGVEDGFAVHEYTGKVTITAAVTKYSENNLVIEWYIPCAEYIFLDYKKGPGEGFEDDIRGLFNDN